MRNILARISSILRSAARYALVPVEIVVNGLRMLVMRPAPLADHAADIIGEGAVGAPEGAFPTPTERAVREMAAGAPAPRVAKAAALLMQGQSVPTRILDPRVPLEASYLAWLRTLGHGQLSVLVAMPAKAVDAHLQGGRRLAGLPFVDEKSEPKAETAAEPAIAQLQRLRSEAKVRSLRRAA